MLSDIEKKTQENLNELEEQYDFLGNKCEVQDFQLAKTSRKNKRGMLPG